MRVQVCVRASPYTAVARGAIGEVVERKRIGTVYEQLKVRFPGGIIGSFYPDELEVLDDSE